MKTLFLFLAGAGLAFGQTDIFSYQIIDRIKLTKLSVAGALNGQVPTYNEGTGRAEWATPPGAGGGEANTASNLGAGTGIWFSKVGVDLRFKSLVSANNGIVLTNDANTITFTLTPSNILLSALGGSLGIAQINATGTPDGTKALFGDGAWKAAALAVHTHAAADITSGILAVANGGTGAGTAAGARAALLPAMAGQALKVLRVNAGETDYELATDQTGGGVGWQESTFGDLPAAAGAAGQTYVVTDAPSKSTCTAGGSSSRAPCRSNGSVWQPVLTEGSDHILMSGNQAVLNPVTVPTKTHLQTFVSNTVTSSGAGPAYVCDVDTGATVAPPNYASIGVLLLRPHATFQANATCNVNTLGAKKLYKMSSGSPVQIGASDVNSNAAYFLTFMPAYDGGAGGFLVAPQESAAAGAPSFSAITSGTNTAAAMIAGAGSSFRANAADATAPSKSGTSLPGTCTVGDTYLKTDATASQQWHICTATNTWTQQGGGGAATSVKIVEEMGQCRGNGLGIYPNGKIGPGADIVGFDDASATPNCWSAGNVSGLFLDYPAAPASYRGARLSITLPDNWNSAGTLTFRFRASSVFGAASGTSAVFAARLGCQGTGATTVLDTTWGTNSTVTVTPGGLAGFGPNWYSITISDKSACVAGQRGEVLLYRIHDDANDTWDGAFQAWVFELTIPLS